MTVVDGAARVDVKVPTVVLSVVVWIVVAVVCDGADVGVTVGRFNNGKYFLNLGI